MNLIRFKGQAELNQALAEEVGDRVTSAIRRNGISTIALSGGKTPLGFFEELSTQKLEWPRVTITLVDERWVDPDHPDSNERLIREHLLKRDAKAARFVGLKGPQDSAKEGEAWCDTRLKECVPLPFSCVVLGMGLDGHTASLFPGAEELSKATDLGVDQLCIAITPTNAPHQRMTLTLKTILNTAHIFLHITGRKKLEVLEKALGPGPAQEMPIRFILRQTQVPVSIYWAP